VTIKPNTYVGQPLERVEDARLLRGRGSFVADIVPEGLLHAAIVRSPVAHGRIRSIDLRAATRCPGVETIFTAADIGDVIPTIPIRLAPIKGSRIFRQPIIAKDKVRFVGEPLAVVVARSRALAEDASELIEIDIRASRRSPIAPRPRATHLLFEQNGTNTAAHYVVSIGDPDAAFAGADYVREFPFATPYGASMEHAACSRSLTWRRNAGDFRRLQGPLLQPAHPCPHARPARAVDRDG
jgi:carbon-monoxide dehydrogenase large subunit